MFLTIESTLQVLLFVFCFVFKRRSLYVAFTGLELRHEASLELTDALLTLPQECWN